MDGPTAVRRVRFIALESETINVVRYSIQHLNLCGASAMKLSFMWSSKKRYNSRMRMLSYTKRKKESEFYSVYSFQIKTFKILTW